GGSCTHELHRGADDEAAPVEVRLHGAGIAAAGGLHGVHGDRAAAATTALERPHVARGTVRPVLAALVGGGARGAAASRRRGVAAVDRETALEESVRERRAAVVGERTELGVDL